jgi:hypothetical protein
LEANAVSAETEVSLKLSGVTLGSALTLIVNQVDELTYVIENEVLLITTEDQAESRLVLRVYRVEDLREMQTVEQPLGASAWADYNPLIGAITDCVIPDSWSENGVGEGQIRVLKPGILVVYQTKDVHDEISDLLSEIRRIKAAIEEDAAGEH